MPDIFEYDAFISYSSTDKSLALELAVKLKNDGLSVWIDEWKIKPGDSIPLSIESGLQRSHSLILIMSQAAFSSEWVSLERQSLLFRDPTNSRRRFIPILIEDCQIPDMLAQFSYIDLRRESSKEYSKLLNTFRTQSKIIERMGIDILIVEDSKVSRNELSDLLKGHNYSVGLAVSGQHAVTKVSQMECKIGIVLMDIKMPGRIDGIESAKRIQDICPNISIIFLTAFSHNKGYQRRVYEEGIISVGWIDKPIIEKNKEKLMNLIEIVLEKNDTAK